MYSIRESITTPLVNTAQEVRSLKAKGYVLEDGKLSAKAKRVIKEVEGFFKRAKKKTSASLMGDNFKDMIKKYNDMWPKMRLPTGKAARSAIGNLEPAFRWFFENHEFTWEQIIKATAYYLDEKEADNWSYTRTSQYFIRKQNTDKTWASELADYCQLIEDGGHKDQGSHFSEKVF
jgi:hypothetical protein